KDPHAFGGLTSVDYYYEFSYMIQEAMDNAKNVIKEAGNEFKQIFGKDYGLIEKYKTDDAEFVLVTYGTISGTAKDAVDKLREQGIAAGVLKIRAFRPFPREEVQEALKNCKKVGVIDRAVSFGHEGPFFTETKAAMFGDTKPFYGFIAGLGGRDVSIRDIESVVDFMNKKNPSNLIWIGVKK
ncbi:MAG TPA: pyruvate ferredoxin oxidoreductase, partial [Firmicutes bacterium]|nr:pyruvate ferredoxin oxidoreductase [Bacillota bacterium]